MDAENFSALSAYDHKLIAGRSKFIQILQGSCAAVNTLDPNLLRAKATAQGHCIQQVGQTRHHHIQPSGSLMQNRTAQAKTTGMAGDPNGENRRTHIAQDAERLALLGGRIACGGMIHRAASGIEFGGIGFWGKLAGQAWPVQSIAVDCPSLWHKIAQPHRLPEGHAVSPQNTPPPQHPRALRWAGLALLSALITTGFELLHLPAALLLGPMVAAIILAVRGYGVTLPAAAMTAAQGLVGMMVASVLPVSMMAEVMAQWPIVLAATLWTIAASALLGWLIARSGILPGTTAIWGSSPGAASAMVLLSDAYGADIRLVAFMQYLRVACVAVAASVVARLFGVADNTMPSVIWFPDQPALGVLQTFALAVVLALMGQRLRLPGAALLLPIGAGMVLMQTGWMQIYLPPWLLALTYAVIGWAIGLRFTPATLGHAMRAFPRVLAAILVLIAVCGGAAAALVQWAGVDPLTAYLATSPGGMDSIAIIAASTRVDVALVMTMHMARFLLVLLLGPSLARWLSRPKA